ncbi:histidine phosphatase family protein [Nocardioides sp. B-3]|uniref:histidine phosphatase family protein n=1 Tax=Nocardioides sp. B-3 TaxID=2895565 RepID=UPI002153699A|nr:histidine phosphatase family protein [Nocardioides sp. B-3]UUZ58364.1 histidine phosphatase family protein [Nocardioides sp. B-3]
MGDLQCAARVFVARHGEAEYESELLSDAGGSLSALGRTQALALADPVAGERIAHVYTSSMSRAVQTGEIVAARLGVGVTVRHDLREFGVGSHAGQPAEPDPFRPVFDDWLEGRLDTPIRGGESGARVIERMCGVLEEAADRYRGEAVLVISHGGAICTAISNPARNLEPRFPLTRPLANCDVIELAADADGWVARSWAGETLPM